MHKQRRTGVTKVKASHVAILNTLNAIMIMPLEQNRFCPISQSPHELPLPPDRCGQPLIFVRCFPSISLSVSAAQISSRSPIYPIRDSVRAVCVCDCVFANLLLAA